jgi:hypothetical protein
MFSELILSLREKSYYFRSCRCYSSSGADSRFYTSALPAEGESRRVEEDVRHAEVRSFLLLRGNSTAKLLSRDYLRKTLVAGEMLRWRLVDQLKTVYPIRPSATPGDGCFTIASIPLPNSDFTGCDEEEIAAALGNVAHVLTLVSRWFVVPLRYQIALMASRSVVSSKERRSRRRGRRKRNSQSPF